MSGSPADSPCRSFVEVTEAAVESPEEEPQAMLLPALSKSRPGAVRHLGFRLLGMSDFSSDFTEMKDYKCVVAKMQQCEYNGQYDKLRRIGRFFERKIKQPELQVVVIFERAIGELYQKNLEKAQKLVKKGLLMCHTKVKSATNARALEGRAFYIDSGIKRHQKKHDKALQSLQWSQALLCDIAPGEDTVGLLYNLASVLLEKGNENAEEILRYFSLARDQCQAYDASINRVPERSLIRMAWVQLQSFKFDSGEGPVLVNHPSMHKMAIEKARNALAAVDTDDLDVRYKVQHQIASCDLAIMDGYIRKALEIATQAEEEALRGRYQKETGEACRRIDWLKALLDSEKGGEAQNSSSTFDVCVLHHPEADDWVNAALYPILGKKKLTVWHLKYSHMPFGEKIMLSEKQSRHIVIVLSPNYGCDVKSNHELNFVVANGREYLLIKPSFVSLDEMTLLVSGMIYLDEDGPDFEEKLITRIS
eukprot:m.184535 g.184535  ORF g.184535 m.184535 type:complete len:478 (+) comp39325_c0_seq5:617-2050(+)